MGIEGACVGAAVVDVHGEVHPFLVVGSIGHRLPSSPPSFVSNLGPENRIAGRGEGSSGPKIHTLFLGYLFWLEAGIVPSEGSQGFASLACYWER